MGRRLVCPLSVERCHRSTGAGDRAVQNGARRLLCRPFGPRSRFREGVRIRTWIPERQYRVPMCRELIPGLTNKKMAREILVIKLGALGDVIRTTPLLRVLEGRITWVTSTVA